MGRRRTVLVLLLPLILALTPNSGQAAPCQFTLGFKALHDLIPAVVGDCREDQHYAANGDAQQLTTGGLLVWRKVDNWTAFTDGYRTWVNGPFGLRERLNTERFAWEAPPAPPVSGPIDIDGYRLSNILATWGTDNRGNLYPHLRFTATNTSGGEIGPLDHRSLFAASFTDTSHGITYAVVYCDDHGLGLAAVAPAGSSDIDCWGATYYAAAVPASQLPRWTAHLYQGLAGVDLHHVGDFDVYVAPVQAPVVGELTI